jgi:hypothetical protein
MSPDDIWLRLHDLTAALEADGLNREERLELAVRQYQRLPPTVRKQLLGELRVLALDLFDLLPLVIAVENAAGPSEQKLGRTG